MNEHILDFVEVQEQRERTQLETMAAAMKDSRIAWRMFEFVSGMCKQGNQVARRIVIDVMTYQPPVVAEYMELSDTEF